MKLQTILLEARTEKTIGRSRLSDITNNDVKDSLIDKYVAILNYFSHRPIVLGSNYDSAAQARGHIKRVIHKNRPMFDLNEVSYFKVVEDNPEVESPEEDYIEESTDSLLNYVGNCVDSFDEDTGESTIDCFIDVSDFAFKEDNAKEITEEEFLERVIIPTAMKEAIADCDEYLELGTDLLCAYNEENDIHYFFN